MTDSAERKTRIPKRKATTTTADAGTSPLPPLPTTKETPTATTTAAAAVPAPPPPPPPTKRAKTTRDAVAQFAAALTTAQNALVAHVDADARSAHDALARVAADLADEKSAHATTREALAVAQAAANASAHTVNNLEAALAAERAQRADDSKAHAGLLKAAIDDRDAARERVTTVETEIGRRCKRIDQLTAQLSRAKQDNKQKSTATTGALERALETRHQEHVHDIQTAHQRDIADWQAKLNAAKAAMTALEAELLRAREENARWQVYAQQVHAHANGLMHAGTFTAQSSSSSSSSSSSAASAAASTSAPRPAAGAAAVAAAMRAQYNPYGPPLHPYPDWPRAAV